MRQLSPVHLEESDCAEETGGEDGAHAEDLAAHDEAAEHLGVHALEGVAAEDCFVRAGVDVVGVVWSGFELVALVVTGENGSGHQPAWSLGFCLYEKEVEALSFVQLRHVSIHQSYIVQEILILTIIIILYIFSNTIDSNL